jgi:pimeloyl-ACP methyl ester carboxylesterase
VITSADGTPIGCRTTGSGPGLLVLHGVMDTSRAYWRLADLLAEDFTVHVVDRRGRGESGPYRAGQGLRTEVEDVRAVLNATGAQRVFGADSGAVIALEAALRLPGITHVAAYEPPIDAFRRQRGVIARYEEEMAAGRQVEALTTILKGLDGAPRWLRMLPRRFLVGQMRKYAAQEPDDELSLLPTVRHDFRVVEEGGANLERFTALRCEVLLIGGTRSPSYLSETLYRLADVLPQAEKVLVEEAGHGSPVEKPHLVVPALRGFLKG